jgi:hypothetical protein
MTFYVVSAHDSSGVQMAVKDDSFALVRISLLAANSQ